MRVAIITDLPFWYEDTMYLNELEKRIPGEGITTKILDNFTIGKHVNRLKEIYNSL